MWARAQGMPHTGNQHVHNLRVAINLFLDIIEIFNILFPVA